MLIYWRVNHPSTKTYLPGHRSNTTNTTNASPGHGALFRRASAIGCGCGAVPFEGLGSAKWSHRKVEKDQISSLNYLLKSIDTLTWWAKTRFYLPWVLTPFNPLEQRDDHGWSNKNSGIHGDLIGYNLIWIYLNIFGWITFQPHGAMSLEW